MLKIKQAVILAGGRGIRLAPITDNLPKPMVDINGKPFIQLIIEKLKDQERVVHIGYNHRYHRAIRKALDMTAKGEIGEVMFLRARYGHGGRIGYNKRSRKCA